MTTGWKRLRPWLPGGDTPAEGAAALRALADVTEVRRALDQAELAAVRVARRGGRSWTEIATMLAVSRQSAWERWRDLDEPASGSSPAGAAREAAGDELLAALVDTATKPGRRRRTSTVPDVVGLLAADALGILTRAGFLAESATPGLALEEGAGGERGGDARPVVVVRQYPEPGVRVKGPTVVRLWLERGDGEAGVREPRRPAPDPRAARAELEQSEPVG